jgi:hypothetical protein
MILNPYALLTFRALSHATAPFGTASNRSFKWQAAISLGARIDLHIRLATSLPQNPRFTRVACAGNKGWFGRRRCRRRTPTQGRPGEIDDRVRPRPCPIAPAPVTIRMPGPCN